MASTLLLSVVVFMLLYLSYRYAYYKPKNFPPGPPRLPCVGSYLFLMMLNPRYLHKGALLLSKIYKSNIIGLYIGNTPAIIANSYEGVKAILTTQAYDGRSDVFVARMRDPESNLRDKIFVGLTQNDAITPIRLQGGDFRRITIIGYHAQTPAQSQFASETFQVKLHSIYRIVNMISGILLSAVVLLFLYISYQYVFYRPKNFPPGPPRIPFFGSYLFLMAMNPTYLHKGALWLSKYYKSKVIGLFIGATPCVITNSYDTAKELLNRQEYDGRPDIFAARLRTPNFIRRGIFFTDGPLWKEQRRFVLRYLRDFGFGRRFAELESAMNDEILDMIDLVKNGPKYPHEREIAEKGKGLCPFFMIPFANNCFMKVLYNERLPRSEQAPIITIGKQGMIFQRLADDYGKLISIIPWIRHIFPEKSSYRPLRDSSAYLYKHMKAILDKCLETYDENHERHFVDVYLREMKQQEAEGVDTTFMYDQFILNTVDFMFPPLTAVATQIAFLFQWFLLKPEVLKKCQAEIDDVVGDGRLPTLDDRINLSYTEATIRECMRLETLVPSSIPHFSMEDSEFFGYDVPKGSIMIPGLYAFHNDKDLWGDPENFRPERFLNEDGKLCLKKDITLPFGAGKRLCAGETFARNLLFLMVSAFCQHFDVVPGPDGKLPDMTQTLSGLITSPPDFWVHLKAR